VYGALITVKEQSVLYMSPAISCKTFEFSPHSNSYRGKIVLGHSMEVYWGGGRWEFVELWFHSFILNLGDRLRQVGRFTACPFYPQERNPGGRSVCPKALEKRKSSCQLPEFL
jgi:hypothetical protein